MYEKHRTEVSESLLRRKSVSPPASLHAWRQFDAKDAIYAATAVSIISGLNILGTPVPWFSVLVIVLCVIDRNLFASRSSTIFLAPPLLLFSAIHLVSAFRVDMGNGLFFVAQFIILFSFIWLLIIRYSSVEMDRFKVYFFALMMALLAYVIWWHVSKGTWVSWKRLSDPKAVFSLLPLALVLTMRSPSARLRRITPVLLLVFGGIVFLSGERKAYFLLLMFLPLLVNLRNPATYLLPLAIMLVVPVAASLDPTGYLTRQLSTLEGFAQGRVVNTVSNEGRSEALKYALETIRENPILGVGTMGQLKAAQHINPSASAPHNEWVRVAAENGVIGLFFYAATVLWGLVGALRTRVLGRYRSRAEKEAALALVTVLIMYISFEALDFIVLLAFLLIPFIQYLRLLPQSPEPVARRTAERGPLRRPDLRPAPR